MLPNKSLLIIQVLLSCSPAIASSLAPQVGQQQQQPLGLGDTTSKAPPTYRDALLTLHKKLVEIPSTTGQEHDAGDFLVDYFISQSWGYELQPVEPRDNTPEGKGRFNIVAWPPTTSTSSSSSKKKPDPKVLVTSHIDCVPPHIPYAIAPGPVHKATRISGRCSVDAKGSVAAQITAVEDLLTSGALAPEDVMLLFVVDEERGGGGMRAFNNATHQFRAVVFGEPTENKLACGHKGTFTCDVTATGKAGHSGYPWLGKSANEVLMRGLVAMLDTDLGSSDKYGNTTVNVGIMEGGVALNVIPAHAKAQLAVRVALEPEDSGYKTVIGNMKKALAGVDDEALELECSPGIGVVQCDCDVDGELCLTIARQAWCVLIFHTPSRLRHHRGQLWHGYSLSQGQPRTVLVRTGHHSRGSW